MKHLVTFYYVIAFSTGLIGLVISLMIYLKTRIKIVLHFFIFYMLLSILVITNTFYFYITSIADFQNNTLHIFFSMIFLLTFGSLIFEGPYVVHQLIGKHFELWKKIVFGTAGGISLFFILIPLILISDRNRLLDLFWFLLYNIYINLFFGVYLYTILFAIFNYRNIKNNRAKIILRAGLLLLIIFLPAFILDGYWKLFQEKLKIIPRYINFMPVFYLFWSIFSIVYSAKYMFVPSVGSGSKFLEVSGITLSENFKKQYGISVRESEIVCLIIQGKGNSDIGEKLFISPGTVKNHIHNIYEKTGAKNRYELANLIKKNS